MPLAVEAVQKLHQDGVAVRYLTNNSSLTQVDFAAKLAKLGFPATPEMVMSTAVGAAHALRKEGVKSAFVLGMPGLVNTLRDVCIEVVNADESGMTGPEGKQAEAVVSGMCRHFNFDLLNGGLQQILRGARFVATNRDSTYPLEGGKVMPGSGALVGALEICSGVEPLTIGKPGPYLVNLILDELGIEPSEALVVGDRVDTDIDAGIAAGCDTMLVLTGVTLEPVDGIWTEPDLSVFL